MRKSIVLTALILIATAFAGHSQNSDTVCIPVADAKRVLIRAEKGRADSAELEIRRREVKDLRYILGAQGETVQSLRLQVSTEQLAVSQARTLNEQLQSALKKAKRRTRIVAIGGLLLTGGVSYLLLK